MTPAPLLAAALALSMAAGPPPAITVESSVPASLWRHPLVADVWAELRDAPLIRDALAKPEPDAVRDPLRFVADRVGLAPGDLLAAATAGGVRLELPAVENGPTGLVVVSDSPETRRAVLGAVRTLAAREFGPAAALLFPPDTADGQEWPLGEDARLRVVGPAVAAAANGADFPADPPAAGGPPLRVAVNLAALRAAGSLPLALAPPWGDPALGGFLGGYAAAAGDATEATLTFADSRRESGDSRGLSIGVALPAGERRADVPGFFAPPAARVSGRLVVPGAIYSAAWFRDYGALWDGRRDLLTAAVAAATERRDGEIRQELKVLGADVRPSDLAATLGDSWRVVVAGGLGSDYAVEPVPALPSAGLAVSLRDAAAFDRLADPLLRGVRLVATFGGAKMQPFAATETVGGIEVAVSGLRFAETPAAARVGDRVRFNAAPTWATFRGHFVAASNRPTLRALLVALDEEAAAPAFLPTGVTEEQRFSPAAFADALAAAAPSIAAGLTLETGLVPADANDLTAAAGRALRRFGPVTLTTRTDDGLRITLDIEPSGATE